MAFPGDVFMAHAKPDQSFALMLQDRIVDCERSLTALETRVLAKPDTKFCVRHKTRGCFFSATVWADGWPGGRDQLEEHCFKVSSMLLTALTQTIA